MSTNDYLRYLNLKEHKCYPPFSKNDVYAVGLQLYLKSSNTNNELWLLLHSRNFSFCRTTLLHCSNILTKTPFQLKGKKSKKKPCIHNLLKNSSGTSYCENKFALFRQQLANRNSNFELNIFCRVLYLL